MARIKFCITKLLFKINVLLLFLFFVFSSFAEECIDRIIFYSIPKTGTLTNKALFSYKFDANEICSSFLNHELEEIKSNDEKEKFHKHKLFLGHFLFSSPILKEVNGKKITFLREPISRVISEHKHYTKHCKTKKTKDLFYKYHILPPGDPLYTASNNQSLFLSSLNIKDSKISIKEHFESAKENLKNEFFFIGILEKFDESWDLLCDLLELPPSQKKTTKLNALATTETSLLNPQLLEEIKKRNFYDIELYKYALSLFEERKEFRRKERLINASVKKELLFTNEITYSFDKKLECEGFYERSICPLPFYHAYTSQKEALVYFSIDYFYNYEISFFVKEQGGNIFEVFVNDIPIDIKKTMIKKHDFIKVTGFIKKEFLIPNQKTKITFKVTKMDYNAEARGLAGIGIGEIKIVTTP